MTIVWGFPARPPATFPPGRTTRMSNRLARRIRTGAATLTGTMQGDSSKGCFTRMMDGAGETAAVQFLVRFRVSKFVACLGILAAIMLSARHLGAQDEAQPVDDITAKYHFLSPDDTLAILDEEGRLKGYIETTLPEDESDVILTFDIVEGS